MQSKPIRFEAVKTKALIRQIFNESNQSVGLGNIVPILMKRQSIKIPRYMVGKLMVQMGLKNYQKKHHKYKAR